MEPLSYAATCPPLQYKDSSSLNSLSRAPCPPRAPQGDAGMPPPVGNHEQQALLKLMEKSGYSIIQENGQRKYGGPPPDWKGDPPAKGSEVFVGKIPRDLYEDELVPLFESVGPIYELRLMMNFGGTTRGYAFVMYTNPEDAKRAIEEFDNFEIRKGKFIGVMKSIDNCKLFIGGLPKTKSREEILEQMRLLTDGVRDVTIYSSTNDKNQSRGFAFIEYENHKAAAMARRKLVPGRNLWGSDIAVDWAAPEPEIDEATMSKVTVLYVRNLLVATPEATIFGFFNDLSGGCVIKVKKIRHFAFVHFVNREAAEETLQKIQEIGTLDGARIEVTWAKPVSRCSHHHRQSKMLPRAVASEGPVHRFFPAGYLAESMLLPRAVDDSCPSAEGNFRLLGAARYAARRYAAAEDGKAFAEKEALVSSAVSPFRPPSPYEMDCSGDPADYLGESWIGPAVEKGSSLYVNPMLASAANVLKWGLPPQSDYRLVQIPTSCEVSYVIDTLPSVTY